MNSYLFCKNKLKSLSSQDDTHLCKKVLTNQVFKKVLFCLRCVDREYSEFPLFYNYID